MKEIIAERAIDFRDELAFSEAIADGMNEVRLKWRNYFWRTYLNFLSLSTNHLKDFASVNGRIWIDEDPEPRLYGQSEEELSRGLFDCTADPIQPNQRFVCELRECKLVGPLAVPFNDEGRLILEPFGGDPDLFICIKMDQITLSNDDKEARVEPWDAMAQSLRLINKPTRDKPQAQEQTLLRMVDFSKNYAHWIKDNLPKLRLMRLYEEETGNKPTILVRPNPDSYINESLSLLGYSKNRILEWEGEEVHADRLVITNHRFENSLNDFMWLRDRCLSQVENCPYPNDERKIYVSRQNAGERMVSNYHMLEEELAARGFEVIKAEFLTFKEQIKIFNSADVIMGPHGAGMANIMFADNPLIIELFPENYVVGGMKCFSDVLGFEHEPIITRSTPNRDLVINIDEFRKVLDDIGV